MRHRRVRVVPVVLDVLPQDAVRIVHHLLETKQTNPSGIDHDG